MRIVTVILMLSCMAATTAPSGSVDLTKQTRVTLQLKDAPLKDATAALARQAAVPFQIEARNFANAGTFEPVTVDLKDEPYLVALAKLCIAAKAAPSQMGGAGKMMHLMPLASLKRSHKDVDPMDVETSWLASPSVSHGPMLVLARSIRTTQFQNLDTPQNRSTPSITLSLVLLSEPQVRITAMCSFAELTEAVGENGQSLLSQHNWTPQWIENPAGSYREFTGVLDPQHLAPRKLARLKGALHVRVEREEVAIPFEFRDLPLP